MVAFYGLIAMPVHSNHLSHGLYETDTARYLAQRIVTTQTAMVNFTALVMAAKLELRITLTFQVGLRCIALE